MQIGEPMLQLLLYKKAQSEQTKIPQSETAAGTAQAVTAESAVAATSTFPTSNDYKIANEFAMSSLNESEKIKFITGNARTSISHALTVSALSAEEITKIKQTIYNLHHGISTPPSTGDGGSDSDDSGSEGTGGTSGSETPPEPNTETSISFMSDFNSVDEMFNYISTIDSTVSKETGISSYQLWELTQRDDWEENNNNFFRKLNSSFELIDTDDNGVLSNDEICTFLGSSVNLSQYNAKVEQYSNDLQTEFQSMTMDEKLEFAINMAREYLTTLGLNEQLQSLERLIREDKIGFADLNPGETYAEGTVGWTLGAYQFWVNNSGNWSSDRDDFKDFDNDGYDDATGIHSSACDNFRDENGDDLDDTTGQTYSQYITDLINRVDPDNDGYDAAGNSLSVYLDFYDEDGDGLDDYFGGIYLDEQYYTRKNANWYELVETLIHELTHATASFHPTEETVWGEYVAYQVGEDYLDSINNSQWQGSDEKTGITTHINDNYNHEPVPSDKWWTYGDYA